MKNMFSDIIAVSICLFAVIYGCGDPTPDLEQACKDGFSGSHVTSCPAAGTDSICSPSANGAWNAIGIRCISVTMPDGTKRCCSSEVSSRLCSSVNPSAQVCNTYEWSFCAVYHQGNYTCDTDQPTTLYSAKKCLDKRGHYKLRFVWDRPCELGLS